MPRKLHRPALVSFSILVLGPACGGPEPVAGCPSTVTDADGTSYPVRAIGPQCWMQRNLATTRYRDGSPIATGLGNTQWKETTSGAYAIYEDKPSHDATYGKLYNGHAVATGQLCPESWHIPSDDDWKRLERQLGLTDAELAQTGERGTLAGKLKSRELWYGDNSAADNGSGFAALPAGSRNSNGEYIVLTQYADFWSSTPYASDASYLWNRHLYYNGAGIGRMYLTKDHGYSCRCIRD